MKLTTCISPSPLLMHIENVLLAREWRQCIRKAVSPRHTLDKSACLGRTACSRADLDI
ncbi:hypothetical protein K443DRAFT_373538 [Laccaria amethystina LaAM-08-1]|uniref:Unplaced genomic scaffold K443scaffold_28, whole genome shotgun sequence n=1 Tax=Laccaria amethystina LaAM-08-1 TaxID=1095629 RepID=A0A0C9WZ67_9AGAR|nr:hypothetical protein K443DRAFT_373538 [Laccaria amethystina LaAM-08-1]